VKRAIATVCAVGYLALGSAVASAHRPAPALVFHPPSASAATAPTLGPLMTHNQRGYGHVRPSTIFNGGDPTGLVTHIRWSQWGGRRAIGQGTGDFVWPGQSVGGGSIQTPATIVAYDRGSCKGHLAYRKIEWYFPSYGQSFEPGAFQGICGQGDARYIPPPRCGDATIGSGEAQASNIQAKGIGCVNARELVANSPALQYFNSGGRFIYAGLYCGTEGYNPELSSPPILYECARGRVSVLFEVSLD
jgi:hypothetical protein